MEALTAVRLKRIQRSVKVRVVGVGMGVVVRMHLVLDMGMEWRSGLIVHLGPVDQIGSVVAVNNVALHLQERRPNIWCR